MKPTDLQIVKSAKPRSLMVAVVTGVLFLLLSLIHI